MRVIKPDIYYIDPMYFFKCPEGFFISKIVELEHKPFPGFIKTKYTGYAFILDIDEDYEPQAAYVCSGFPVIFGWVDEDVSLANQWDDLFWIIGEKVTNKLKNARKRRRVHSVPKSPHRSSGYV